MVWLAANYNLQYLQLTSIPLLLAEKRHPSQDDKNDAGAVATTVALYKVTTAVVVLSPRFSTVADFNILILNGDFRVYLKINGRFRFLRCYV